MNNIMRQLNKCATYTDIHFGAHSNSELHNKDCIDYLKWFCGQVKSDKSIDHIIFAGDYFEHRSAISGLTMKYAYDGMKMVNDLGLPVFVIVGNHDLFFRNNRNISNTEVFSSLRNVTFINEITEIEYIGDKGCLLVPFLFEQEYPELLKYVHRPVVFGHFEFKNFVITGDTIVKESGPDHTKYKDFKHIFSGHYHKRQKSGNVSYVGSTFPTNFADANDFHRGMMTYQYDTDEEKYIDWDDCPNYVRCKLSDLIDGSVKITNKSVIKAIVDIDMSYEESLKMKEIYSKKKKVRELNFEEKLEILDEDDTEDVVEMDDNMTINDVILSKLESIESKDIDNELLMKIYKELK